MIFLKFRESLFQQKISIWPNCESFLLKLRDLFYSLSFQSSHYRCKSPGTFSSPLLFSRRPWVKTTPIDMDIPVNSIEHTISESFRDTHIHVMKTVWKRNINDVTSSSDDVFSTINLIRTTFFVKKGKTELLWKETQGKIKVVSCRPSAYCFPFSNIWHTDVSK